MYLFKLKIYLNRGCISTRLILKTLKILKLSNYYFVTLNILVRTYISSFLQKSLIYCRLSYTVNYTLDTENEPVRLTTRCGVLEKMLACFCCCLRLVLLLLYVFISPYVSSVFLLLFISLLLSLLPHLLPPFP